MKSIILNSGLKKLFSEKQRKLGRYSVSDIWAMTNGYLPIDKFFIPEPFSVGSAANMFLGSEKHLIAQKLLKEIYPKALIEDKKEIAIDDFVIVGKADFIDGDKIWEIKTSIEKLYFAKSWHTYQLKWYLWLFDKKYGSIVQPVIEVNGKRIMALKLNILNSITRDDDFINRELKKLKKYHEELKILKVAK